MKKLLSLALCVVILMTALPSCGLLRRGEDGYVSLDINPSIGLVVDPRGRVVQVYTENEDAQVLLYGEVGIVGVSVEKAVEKITQLAVELGYLSEDNHVVDVLTSGISDKKIEAIEAKIETSADGCGLSVQTSENGSYSLNRRLDELKAKYPDNEKIQNLSLPEFKLALSVSETGKMTLEAALDLDEQKLIETLRTQLENVEEYATEAFRAVKAGAEFAYESAKLLASDAIYATYYATHVLAHPDTVYYGSIYGIYHTVGAGFRLMAEAVDAVGALRTTPIGDEQAQKIADAFGLESTDVLKNKNGEITLDSIDAYADVFFKNNVDPRWNDVKASLSDAIRTTQDILSDEIAVIGEEYKEEIELIKAAIDTAYVAAKATYETIKRTSFGEKLGAYLAEYESIVAEIDGYLSGETKFSSENLRLSADRVLAKAADVKTNIDLDLSERELKEIADLQEKAIRLLEKEKKAFDSALTEAERTAKEYLAKEKQSRTA